MVTSPQAQSSAPSISLATLRAVLAKGQAAHPELACRMERAALIVVQRRIAPAMAPANRGTCYWVEASDGRSEYWVCQDARGNYRFDACTCPDYQQRGGPCKHAIAVRLLQACERAEARRAPVPLPALTLDPDAPIPFVLTRLAEEALDPEPVPAA